MEKKCKRCGTDVSQAKRIKDPGGNYFCEPCYAAAKSAKARTAPSAPVKPLSDDLDFADAKPAAAPASHSSSASREPGADEYDLAPVEAKKEEPKAPCGVCKQFKPERVVQFIDGESICNTCLAKRKQSATGETRERELDPASLPSPFVAFMTGGAGVAITAVGSIIAVLAIMTFSFWFTLGAGGSEVDQAETGFGVYLLVGSIYTVYVVILSAMLLGSMLIVDKLLGGVGFGTVSGVIWKSMLIITIQTCLSVFGHVYEGVAYSNYAVGPVLNFLGFMVLFKLDFFESMLLSIANWVIGYIAGLAIVALLYSGWVLPEMHRGGHPEKEDAPTIEPATENGVWLQLPRRLKLGTELALTRPMLLSRVA